MIISGSLLFRMDYRFSLRTERYNWCSAPGLLHYLFFAWKLMNASVEASTASMEASMETFMEVMEDFVGI